MASDKYEIPRPLAALLKLIRELRPDLRELFPLGDGERLRRWLIWLVTSGIHEYRQLVESPHFRTYLARPAGIGQLSLLQWLIYWARPDVQQAYPLPEQSEAMVAWFYRHGVEEHALWPLLADAERARLLATEPWRSRFAPEDVPATSGRAEYPFGVNLIGYAYGQLGIGEDLRMAARALLKVGVPVAIVDFPPGKDIPQNDRSMAPYVVDEGPYSVNIFCMTALEHGRFFAARGNRQIAGRINIGYWPWELSRWPEAWQDLTGLVDEVWVSTRHTYDALAPVSPVPVLTMPMAVELGRVSRKGRDHFGLPARARLFCFSFDLNSSIHRKSPQKCIDAFLLAFPRTGRGHLGREEVGLVIKAHRPARRHREWERLKALAEQDDRIHIIEQTLPRPDLLALYKACDCYVSLHRAEGFGRGIAEALQLGMHVIATGYSGNVDFCRPPHADLVRYKLIPVRKGQYPYGSGQVWADADVAHAAALMKAYAGSPAGPHDIKRAGWPEFSPRVVGARYKARLEILRGRPGVATRLIPRP